MKNIRLHFVCISFLFISSLTVSGQVDNIFSGAKQRAGFQIGFANKYLLERTYEYDVTLFQYQHFWSLASNKYLGMDLLAQPQLNLTRYRYNGTWPRSSQGIEFGLNIGLVLRANLFDDLIGLYAAASLGPHYLTSAPKRQAKGFIFSDNVFAGINIKTIQNIYLDLRVGLRHISNAGLIRPNAGINNFIISGGVLVNLKTKKV